MDVYKGWAEKSEKLWFERAKQLPQVEALLRVARAAKKAWDYRASTEDIDELHEALEEVKDIL